jgi:hypothetical protein
MRGNELCGSIHPGTDDNIQVRCPFLMLSKLFDIEQSGNRIDLLTHQGREHITNLTVNWWESQDWQVVLWDNTGYLPAHGRNKIIQDFKNSERSLLIMADDDITLYTHRYLTQQWLKNPVSNGVYTLNSNHKMHILMQYSRDWKVDEYNWTQSHHIGQMYIISNKTVPLQDETLPALEDMDWAWQCQSQGINTYMLNNVFLREQSTDKGSIFCSDRKKRVELYQQSRIIMEAKWGTSKYGEFKKKYAVE